MNLLVELAVNYFCPLVIFFAHELHGLTRIHCDLSFNGDLYGRTDWH